MEVSRVEMRESQHSYHESLNLPYTVFSLDESEQNAYDGFVVKLDELRAIPRGRTPEKEEHEKEVKAMFLDLINPYLNSMRLEALGCGIFYGPTKEVLLRLPIYTLFTEEERSDIGGIEFTSWFSVEDELACRTHFAYIPTEDHQHHQRRVIYDLFKKQTEKFSQTKAKLMLHGDFVYFAPFNMAVPLFLHIKDTLSKLGKESLEELVALRRHISNLYEGEPEITRRVLEEAYERKLSDELALYDLLGEINS